MTNAFYNKVYDVLPGNRVGGQQLEDEFLLVEQGFDKFATALNGTSTTSVLIGTGSKSFTASTAKQWSVGQFLTIANTPIPGNFMNGQVTSYNATTGALVMNISDIGGSGTFADWSISISSSGQSGLSGSLAASTGSGMVGFSHSSTYTTGTVGSKLKKIVSITDAPYGALGQNVVVDSSALVAAVDALGSTGGTIYLPPLAVGAYKFNPYVLTDLGTGTHPISLVGDGWATKVEIGAACTNFFTLNGAWSELRNFQIIDPNNFCTSAFILSKPSTGAPSLERLIANIRGVGPGVASTATLLVNQGGQQLRANNIYAQNVLGAFWNKSGGVDSELAGIYGLGIKYGVRIDSDATYGHAENLRVSNATLLCTQENAIALWVTDSLHCRFDNVVGGQLGLGGIGCYMDGITGIGSNFTELISCYFEGSNGGTAIRSRGANARFHMIGGGIGQGAYAASVINGIDFAGANGFIFDNVEAFFPAGNANKVAAISNSSGVVTSTCKGWGLTTNPNTETAAAIRWELAAGEGLPPTRATTSQYPLGDWTVFTPAVISGTGTISTLGALDCADRVDGKTCTVRISVAITTNGTAATSIFVPLRTAGKTGKTFCLNGSENGVTGKALTAVISGSGMTIRFFDNTYPGANSAVLLVSGSYEID